MQDRQVHQHWGVAGTVLLVTADVVRAGRIAHALTSEGLIVTVAFDLQHARSCLKDLGVQVVALDAQVLGAAPDAHLRELRRVAGVPILALVSGGTPDLDRLFRAGVAALAPVDGAPPELAGPVRGLLGIADPFTASPGDALTWGPIRLDNGHRSIAVNGREIAVTPLQLRLVAVLLAAQGDVVSHRSLYRMLWQTTVDDGGQRLAAHVHRLRERLGEAGALLLTVRGAGYRLADLPETPAVDDTLILLRELDLQPSGR